MIDLKQDDYSSDKVYFDLLNDLKNVNFSFSQNWEDLRLARSLNKEDGFFVDVGSAHPIDESVTFFFDRKGWNGLCIDAFPQRKDLYEKLRPNSKLIDQYIINDGTESSFYKVFNADGSWTGLSTSSKKIADEHKEKGCLVDEVKISGITLNDLLISNNVKKDFDLLSVDVEGTAIEVLSNDFFKNFRPKVICLESTFPNSSVKDTKLINFVKSNSYFEIVHDGINSFFVPKEVKDNYKILSFQFSPFVDYGYFQWSAFKFGKKHI